MKIKVPSETEIELDIVFPAYYKTESHYAAVKSEEEMLTLFVGIRGSVSITDTSLTEENVNDFIVKGEKISAEEFGRALAKANRVIESYYHPESVNS